MNNIIVKEYLGSRIEFKVLNGGVYANATSMCKPFNKLAKDWLKTGQTKRYISALEQKDIYPNGLFLVSKGGQVEDSGTWIHEKLVLKLAQWLDVDFELFCDEVVATLIREGTVSLTPKSEEDMLLELFPDTDSNLVLLTANTIRENKRLVLENKSLVTEVIRKEDIIIGYVDKTTLAEKRQILNRVVKHNTSDYKARYVELYRQFEMKYHINLNYRFNKYNEENTPKCKSKMAYICEIMGNTNELYEIAVKLYESDVKELVAQMYGLKDTTVI